MAESGKRLLKEGNQRCRSFRFRGNAKIRIHVVRGKERPHQLVWIFTSPVGHRSRVQDAVVASGCKAEWQIGVDGVARELSLEFGRRMSLLRSVRRAFEAIGTTHRLLRVLLAGARACRLLARDVNGDPVDGRRESTRKQPSLEQHSKEKTLFDNALDEETVSLEEPVFDELF